MTNNPTIDGVLVPRELLELCWLSLVDNSSYAGEVRALLDAPAVERQEPVAYDFNPTQYARQFIVSAMPPGKYIAVEHYAAMQSTIARLEARITQLESEKEFAAATYQAARDRIAELESGRGDDWLSLAHEFQLAGLKCWDAHQRERGDGAVKFLHNDETGATFVVTRGEHAQELKDFIFGLDAIPALNGPDK